MWPVTLDLYPEVLLAIVLVWMSSSHPVPDWCRQGHCRQCQLGQLCHQVHLPTHPCTSPALMRCNTAAGSRATPSSASASRPLCATTACICHAAHCRTQVFSTCYNSFSMHKLFFVCTMPLEQLCHQVCPPTHPCTAPTLTRCNAAAGSRATLSSASASRPLCAMMACISHITHHCTQVFSTCYNSFYMHKLFFVHTMPLGQLCHQVHPPTHPCTAPTLMQHNAAAGSRATPSSASTSRLLCSTMACISPGAEHSWMTVQRRTGNNKLKALWMTTKSQFIITVLIFGCDLIWPETNSLLSFFSILARKSSPWLYIFLNKTSLDMFSSTSSLFFFFLLTCLSGSSIFHLPTHLANHFSYNFLLLIVHKLWNLCHWDCLNNTLLVRNVWLLFSLYNIYISRSDLPQNTKKIESWCPTFPLIPHLINR